jgi:hypothetical protein
MRDEFKPELYEAMRLGRVVPLGRNSPAIWL